MRHRLLTGLLAMVMGFTVSAVAAQDDSGIPPEMAARYAEAVWTYPTASQMADTYDGETNVNSIVQIDCAIATDGYLKSCNIVSETPAGYGFGQATSKPFVAYAHVDPQTVHHGIRPGDHKIFTYNWTFE